MATTSAKADEKTGVTQNVEAYLKGRFSEAQKRFQGLEGEANKAFRALETRGQVAAKEVQTLWTKVQAGELRADPRVQELSKKVDAASGELRKRLDGLQTKVVEAVGVASQSQVEQITRELSRLSKKLDVLLKPTRRAHRTTKNSGGAASSPRA
ncbi:hypothetical protein HRD49_02835 [Corallococcus exiguus]|uniref:Phasin family protein n=1 Tax=Corallococcus exiguus TaxID=83462 RepID=A0A7Y1S310_9BACT|nr:MULTISPECIES: hypothetical protein [Corallococcus]NBC44233.1 hypothetical protein [Corallococcus exiguus]NNC17227.1 hypothetical protein [Corallococcus exiguus]NRD60676.1 hypothetical protein [Corallococcus exiguus]RKH24725.1 hypothetical protein D7V77_19880 [Corallococcus sp. CA041A]RKI08400.1 hypothetical protein D7Y15_25920 [Corallococcus sp. AB030]